MKQSETNNGKPPVLRVSNLGIRFGVYGSALARTELTAISALDFELQAGELAAVIGSSGSGKSLLAHAVLGILPANARLSGSIQYQGEPLTRKRLEALRGTEIALVPQSVNYLDPTMKVGTQAAGVRGSLAAVKEVFARYRLPAEAAELYPFQLSGGMARRVLVAAAVIAGAKLVIADEPTPGLSEALAREALAHLRELADAGCAVMLITHDLPLALTAADRVTVFYAGLTMETARKADFAEGGRGLRHPYTRALWEALPQNRFTPLPGFQPPAGALPGPCAFYPRCPDADAECLRPVPLRELRGGTVRCIHAA